MNTSCTHPGECDSPRRPGRLAQALIWLGSGLHRRFAFATTIGLISSSMVFLVLFVVLYRDQLAHERSVAASQVSRLLETSIENAMLNRDLDGLETIVERLGNERDVRDVMIANPRGIVRFASRPDLIGHSLDSQPLIPEAPATQFLQRGDDWVLRSVHPIRNTAACQGCHGTISEHPLNGVLYVDFLAEGIREQARATTLVLMGAGALVVLLNVAGGWWFIRRYVLTPVEHLSAVSARFGQGDLAARARLAGRGELAALGTQFDRMAARLATQMDEIAQQRDFVQQLVDAIPDGIRVIDNDYQVVLSNRTYNRQIGREPGPDMPNTCYAQTHERSAPCPSNLIACPLNELGDTHASLRCVHRHMRRGKPMDVEIFARRVDLVCRGRTQSLVVESIRDLGEEIAFSHELKLSELGRLAAGVAHEIHNPLAAMRLALHAAAVGNQRPRPNRVRISELLTLIDHEVEKCNEVTQRLLKLSIPPSQEAELIDVLTVIGETLALLRWDANQCGVELILDAPEKPLRTLAGDSDLRMITLNLAQNACHAMPEGGTLRVVCRRDAGWIVIAFEDTGTGIDPRERLAIFEPFFSRRADGIRGTGLGLPITKSIIEHRGGRIAVDFRARIGARIVVRLPDADDAGRRNDHRVHAGP